uniref:NADH dehydrogenase subunit 2 n=1 Tax=Macrostomum lignano TaxID=282301 RepID=A0A1Z1M032_9PLAT|nr:NADH dehydrogenase subunit 2 [Macrostomum lignano]ARW59245.1 NADH dehydrogenase subunit 2 [Macrostomum lignano]ATA64827.1 NADH dehydrogenase subunit 2 [Macrostomum lignano]
MFSFNYFSIFLFLSFISISMNNAFFTWCILEVYSLIFLLFVFTSQYFFENKNSFVYFGLLNLFFSVVLIFSLVNDIYFLSFLSLVGKMGSFPMMEWVINFVNNSSWEVSWYFFSVNKIIPVFFVFEYLNNNVFLVLAYFFFNTFISIQNAFLVNSFHSLISWSAIGGTGFFVFLVNFSSNFFLFLGLLFIYSLNLFVIFFNINNLNHYFWLIILLFGIPPFSMFVFKVSVFSVFINFYGIFLNYFFLFFFFFMGVSYFYFFFKESQNLLIQNTQFTFLGNFWFFLVLFFCFSVLVF